MYYDLRTVCYEGFLDFIFDHPVPPANSRGNWNIDPRRSDNWYDAIDLEIDFDPARHCEYFTLLFCDPLALLERYSLPQVGQAFWWMQASFNDGSAADVLWTPSIPVKRRVAMIDAMYFLYSDLFARVPLGRSTHMWWENMAKGAAGYAIGANWQADRNQIEDAIFGTLARLLELDAKNCRINALHGLNHLVHPCKEQLIRDYLSRHPDLDGDHRLYAEKAITGALT